MAPHSVHQRAVLVRRAAERLDRPMIVIRREQLPTITTTLTRVWPRCVTEWVMCW